MVGQENNLHKKNLRSKGKNICDSPIGFWRDHFVDEWFISDKPINSLLFSIYFDKLEITRFFMLLLHTDQIIKQEQGAHGITVEKVEIIMSCTWVGVLIDYLSHTHFISLFKGYTQCIYIYIYIYIYWMDASNVTYLDSIGI